MDHRTGTRIVRALADGVDSFVAAIEAADDFDPAAFAELVRKGNVREWLVPVVDDARARALLPHGFVHELEELGAALPEEKRAILAQSCELRDAFADAAIPALFMKGLYVARRFYGDVLRRHQYDVDVLVEPDDFERAIDVLERLGFDTSSERIARRRAEIGERSVLRAPQTITLRRPSGFEVDLHCRTKSRWFEGLDEDALWTDRRVFRHEGEAFETLSDEHTLLLLTLSLCLDLRRAAARTKHFLDLYLMLRDLDAATDWDAFLERHRRTWLIKPIATTWTVLLVTWDAAAELPRLARALGAVRGSIKLTDPVEALRLVERPRGAASNRAWYLSVQRLSTWSEMWGARYQYLFHRLARVLRPRRRGDGWPWERVANACATGPEARLPRPIGDLLAREGLAATRAEEITTRPGEASQRSTHRIELADGRVVKGRTQAAPVVENMRRWCPALPERSFPRLLASAETATLEEWRDGTPLATGASADELEAAGAILGRVHELAGPTSVGWDDDRLRATWENVARWAATLREAGALEEGEVRAVLESARALRPDRATWGLVHLDFCRENLIRTDDGLCCVDNATLTAGPRELDLAQTFTRWPLAPDERAAFLRGYANHADPAPALAHEGFWNILVAVRSASFRVREGTTDHDVPLRRLRAHAS